MRSERIEERIELQRTTLPDGSTQEVLRVERITERSGEYAIEELPRPPRVPDFGPAHEAARQVRIAHEARNGFRAPRITSTGSTLRLVRESEAA